MGGSAEKGSAAGAGASTAGASEPEPGHPPRALPEPARAQRPGLPGRVPARWRGRVRRGPELRARVRRRGRGRPESVRVLRPRPGLPAREPVPSGGRGFDGRGGLGSRRGIDDRGLGGRGRSGVGGGRIGRRGSRGLGRRVVVRADDQRRQGRQAGNGEQGGVRGRSRERFMRPKTPWSCSKDGNHSWQKGLRMSTKIPSRFSWARAAWGLDQREAPATGSCMAFWACRSCSDVLGTTMRGESGAAVRSTTVDSVISWTT